MGFASVEMHCLAVILKWLPLFGHHCTKQLHTVAPTLNSLRFTCTLGSVWARGSPVHWAQDGLCQRGGALLSSDTEVAALVWSSLHKTTTHSCTNSQQLEVHLHTELVVLVWSSLHEQNNHTQPHVSTTLKGSSSTCTFAHWAPYGGSPVYWAQDGLCQRGDALLGGDADVAVLV